MAWNLTRWAMSTPVRTAKTIIWRPPPQYSVLTSAWVPKYSPLPSRCPDEAPRRLGSRPLARMFGMFWGLYVNQPVNRGWHRVDGVTCRDNLIYARLETASRGIIA